jgi:hypothetical protein
LIRVGAADRDRHDDSHEIVGVDRGDFAEVDGHNEVLSRNGTAVDRAAERARDARQAAAAEIISLRGGVGTRAAKEQQHQQREQAWMGGNVVGASLHNRAAFKTPDASTRLR